jgi:DNA-binding PadR family transcriptional regulator
VRKTPQTKLVLDVLSTRDAHGFWIAHSTGIKTGTLYPLLRRLEDRGYVTAKWEKGTPEGLGRPLRRFYSLTNKGRKLRATW